MCRSSAALLARLLLFWAGTLIALADISESLKCSAAEHPHGESGRCESDADGNLLQQHASLKRSPQSRTDVLSADLASKSERRVNSSEAESEQSVIRLAAAGKTGSSSIAYLYLQSAAARMQRGTLFGMSGSVSAIVFVALVSGACMLYCYLSPGDSEHEPVVLPKGFAVKAFLSRLGYCRDDSIVVTLDPARDSEESADGEVGKPSLSARAAHTAENVAKHKLMSAACYGHPPGFVFGIGNSVYKKGEAQLHMKHVQQVEGCSIRVEALRVSKLPPLRSQHLPSLAAESPYVTVQLVMEGIDISNDAFRARTKSAKWLGTEGNFHKNTDACVALPLGDLEASARACLFVEVLDEPDFSLLARCDGSNSKFGSAMVELGSLLDALKKNRESAAACHVNLDLYKDDELKTPDALPTGGTVRLYIHCQKMASMKL